MICRDCLRANEQFVLSDDTMVKQTRGPGKCPRCQEDVSVLYEYKAIPGLEAAVEDSVEEEEEEAGEEEEVVEVEPMPEAPAEEVTEGIPADNTEKHMRILKDDGDTNDAGRAGDEDSVPVPEVQLSAKSGQPAEGLSEVVLSEVPEERVEGEEEAEAPKAKKRTKAELEAYIAELEAKVQK